MAILVNPEDPFLVGGEPDDRKVDRRVPDGRTSDDRPAGTTTPPDGLDDLDPCARAHQRIPFRLRLDRPGDSPGNTRTAPLRTNWTAVAMSEGESDF